VTSVKTKRGDLVTQRRYLLTGGGTGGHVTPAIALANELRERDPDAQFLYVGIKSGKEAEIVPKYGYDLKFVQSHQWTFRSPLDPVRFAIRMSLGVLKSMWILLLFRPHAVIGTGGYVAAPIVFANLILRKLHISTACTLIHEQNITPGRLNARVGNAADAVLVSFANTAKLFKRAAYVGYPVRKEIRPGDHDKTRDALGIPRDVWLVFVFGGSMGARTVNRAIIDALPHLKKQGNIRVVHGRGRKLTAYDPESDCRERLEANGLSEAQLEGWYESHPFIDRMADYYAAADLIVGRSGAGTLSELCASGRPALLIPKANLPGDHQVMNALELFRAGAADILYEDVVTKNGVTEEFVDGGVLADHILQLLHDPARRADMSEAALRMATPESLEVSADLIEKLADGGQLHGKTDGLPHPPIPTGVHAGLAHLSGEGLRARATLMVNDLRESVGDEDELIRRMARDEVFAYLRYRASVKLASPAWRVRNAAIKMVGTLRHREKLPLLLELLCDKTPAPFLQRMLGGDYHNNGFLRRNAMVSLGQLGLYSDDVRRVLLGCLDDPYFEVRTQTCATIAQLVDGHDEEIETAVLRAMDDRMFDVQIAALRTLGHVGRAATVIPHLRDEHYNPNWKVREAVIEAYTALIGRGETLDIGELREELNRMVVTSTGFVPAFPLKTAISTLASALDDMEQRGGKR
jgi:UDP-N-acetylglucosamine--N-acetylmuramyl-(pentapeptide) pyrophosphoryl-undecaprenol N-acetylglucosamine transferase